MKRMIQQALAVLALLATFAAAHEPKNDQAEASQSPVPAAVIDGPTGHDQVAPALDLQPVLLGNVKSMGLEFKGLARADRTGIKAHVLITLSGRDGVQVEQAVEVFRFVPGALFAAPLSQ